MKDRTEKRGSKRPSKKLSRAAILLSLFTACFALGAGLYLGSLSQQNSDLSRQINGVEQQIEALEDQSKSNYFRRP